MKAKKLIYGLLITLLVLLAILMAYIAFGGSEYHIDQITDMQVTCERSHLVINGPLEKACGDKIDALQQKGYEVLVKDGLFTVEKQ